MFVISQSSFFRWVKPSFSSPSGMDADQMISPFSLSAVIAVCAPSPSYSMRVLPTVTSMQAVWNLKSFMQLAVTRFHSDKVQ